MRKARCSLLGVLFLVLFAAACQTAAGAPRELASLDDVTNGFVATDPSPRPAEAARAYGNAGFDDFGSHNAAPIESPAQPRLLIQKGEVRVEVARPDDAAREFQAKVAAWGGYLQQQNGAILVLRLPAAKFDEAFTAAKALGRVLGESRSANDVTEEFVDLGIRIDNARKSRDRLVEILAKAEKVEDILKVEAELRRLTEEIERMEGRKKFLQDQVAMATLQLTLQPVSQPPPVKRSRQWSRFDWINQVGAEQMLGGDF
ncbi:MAG: DUF4349 domain-containing protein [Planctomycetes bacterium]|nr:DUF4349 domain-containing protein [Planctomycetota bacterium]